MASISCAGCSKSQPWFDGARFCSYCAKAFPETTTETAVRHASAEQEIFEAYRRSAMWPFLAVLGVFLLGPALERYFQPPHNLYVFIGFVALAFILTVLYRRIKTKQINEKFGIAESKKA
ncbi:MAG: hypothetical protein A2939_00650 [Parcubacteria group bacterium RIFCSPLOWO2_01_FULL_48_18]|nr:MAG: hypothetical protein A2939_00650 [Parcubacteria group bacterium RIFCSPLOWO2_01_FULL_48_18]